MREPPDEPSKQALITALRLLAASPKSLRELKARIEAGGYPADAVRFALDELVAQGILDDKAYARNLANQLIHGKSSGRHKIAFELKRHGVPGPVRNEIIDSLTEDGERERALELARMKWPGLSKLEPLKRKKKIFDYLIRKGYDFQIVHDVLDQVAKDIPDGTDSSL